jgi:hypothetical protein
MRSLVWIAAVFLPLAGSTLICLASSRSLPLRYLTALLLLLVAILPVTAETIPLEHQGGTYVIPVRINDAITLKFILDSGVADVSIPEDVVPRWSEPAAEVLQGFMSGFNGGPISTTGKSASLSQFLRNSGRGRYGPIVTTIRSQGASKR